MMIVITMLTHSQKTSRFRAVRGGEGDGHKCVEYRENDEASLRAALPFAT